MYQEHVGTAAQFVLIVPFWLRSTDNVPFLVVLS